MYACTITKNVPAWNTTMKGGRPIGWLKPGYVRGNAPVNGWAQINITIRARKKTYSPVYVRVKHLKGYKPETIVTPPPPPKPEPVKDRPRIWRVLHYLEVDDDRRSRPGMQPLFPNHYVKFGEGWQKLSKAMNPLLTPRQWTVIYGGGLWIANGQGFDMDDDPRNNYVTGKMGNEDPKVECLATTGSLLAGEPRAGLLHVDVLDYRNVPTLEWIMARPWYWTYAVNVDANGTPRRFPQGMQPNGYMADIIHPLVGDPERFPAITIPMWQVIEWTDEEMPDPYRVYL